MPRCLVVHPGALGDVLLAGPALAHLRALGFRTTLAVTSRLVPLFRGSGLVDDACDLEALALHRLFVEPPGAAAHDVVASFDAVACWLGAGDSAFRANLARLGRPTVVARAVPPPGTGRHVSRHLLETLAPLGPLPAGLPSVRLRVTEASRAVAGAWLAARGIGPAQAVVLQPGAGSAAKVWPGFAALAGRLRAAGLPLVALAGPADGPVVQALLDGRGAGGGPPRTGLAASGDRGSPLARACCRGQRFGPDPPRGRRGLPDRGALRADRSGGVGATRCPRAGDRWFPRRRSLGGRRSRGDDAPGPRRGAWRGRAG